MPTATACGTVAVGMASSQLGRPPAPVAGNWWSHVGAIVSLSGGDLMLMTGGTYDIRHLTYAGRARVA